MANNCCCLILDIKIEITLTKQFTGRVFTEKRGRRRMFVCVTHFNFSKKKLNTKPMNSGIKTPTCLAFLFYKFSQSKLININFLLFCVQRRCQLQSNRKAIRQFLTDPNEISTVNINTLTSVWLRHGKKKAKKNLKQTPKIYNFCFLIDHKDTLILSQVFKEIISKVQCHSFIYCLLFGHTLKLTDE